MENMAVKDDMDICLNIVGGTVNSSKKQVSDRLMGTVIVVSVYTAWTGFNLLLFLTPRVFSDSPRRLLLMRILRG